jgi:hypothetical protein
MVMMIGLSTMSALVWILASSMARESDAEKRRMSELPEPRPPSAGTRDMQTARQAA